MRFPAILFLALALQGAGPEDAEQRLNSARDLFLQGRPEEARRSYERLLPRLRSEAERKHLGDALNVLSLIDSSLGDYERAFERAREAAAVRREIGDRVGLARSTNNMGLALLYLGDYEGALAHYGEALVLDLENGDAEGEILRLNNIGNVYFFQGRYGEALRRYQTAMERVDATVGEPWNPHERQRTVANLAALYQRLGRYERALDLYVQLRTAENVLSASESARVLANQGALYRHLGDPVKALETYREALRLFEEQRHLDGETGVWKNIGIARAMDFGDLEGALESFERVVRLAEQTSNARERIQARLYRGEVLRRLGRPADSAADLEAAYDEASILGLPEEQWKALYALGRLAGDPQEALERYRSAVAIIESVRSRLRIVSLRTEFLADKRDVFDALIRIVMDDAQRAPEAAHGELFDLMERARARSFRDHLQEFVENAAAARSPDLARRMRELRGRMAILWSRLRTADPAGNEELQARLAELETQYETLERRLMESAGDTAGRSEQSLEELQSQLGPDTALVEVWTGESMLALLWVTRDRTGLIRRELPEDLLRSIRACSEAIARPPVDGWDRPCSGLGGQLLSGLPDALGPSVTSLAVVTDEELAFLPLEVLALPGGDLVLERYSVSYLPSASLASRPAKRAFLQAKMPWSRTLVAYGDPVIPAASGESGEGAGFGSGLQPLPHAAAEARAVAARLHGRKELHLGPAALKASLLDRGPQGVPLLHFSTHAAIDSANPDRSWIAFSSAGSTAVDYLFLGEVFSLDLRGTDLVTLSACETARGRLVRGEGVQDFGRAFLMTGARATVSTLWRVSDEPTAQFMERFYAHMAEGRPIAQALRTTKLQFLQSGSALAHPYYWAAFILTGDGETVIVQPLSWAAFIGICAATVSALALLVVWLRRRRQ